MIYSTKCVFTWITKKLPKFNMFKTKYLIPLPSPPPQAPPLVCLNSGNGNANIPQDKTLGLPLASFFHIPHVVSTFKIYLETNNFSPLQSGSKMPSIFTICFTENKVQSINDDKVLHNWKPSNTSFIFFLTSLPLAPSGKVLHHDLYTRCFLYL